MYLEHFGLAEEPFSISPNPQYLSMTPQHKTALFKCRYLITRKSGLGVVYGEVGMGKTTIARSIYESTRSNSKDNLVAMIVTPDLKTETAFLRQVMIEFDQQPKRSYAASMTAFQEFAVDAYLKNKNLVLIIDEAQKLTPRMFETLKSLLNFEANTAKFLQIILLGQIELAANIDKIDAIKSRVASFSSLDNLSRADTEKMIRDRWDAAGGNPKAFPFPRRVLDSIHNYSLGRPREINKIADAALLSAFAEETSTVTTEMIDIAADEFRLIERRSK